MMTQTRASAPIEWTAVPSDSRRIATALRRRVVRQAMDCVRVGRVAEATELLWWSTQKCARMDNSPVEIPPRHETCVRYSWCEPGHHQFAGSCVYSPIPVLGAVR